MRRRENRTKIIAVVIVVVFLAAYLFLRESNNTVIGSGSKTGVYYLVANSICDSHQDITKKCKVLETEGSVHNLEMLKKGKTNFAIVQSDTQYNAYKGLEQFTGDPFTKLRSVFSVYPESFTVVVSGDSDIIDFFDLVDANINTGTIGSGTRHTTDLFLTYLGADKETLKEKSSLSHDEAQEALCLGELDGMVFVTGHPSPQVNKTLLACGDTDLYILPLDDEEIDNFVESNPFLQKSNIPAKAYLKNTDIPTFGVSANLVTTSDVSEEDVYEVINQIFLNLGALRETHNALLYFDETDAIEGAIPSPIHDGAKKYFVERGLL